MKISYRESKAADCIEEARAILVDTRRSGGFEAERQRWLYLDNPDGEATLWLAYAGAELAGYAALIPRRVRVDGVMKRAWNTADLSVRGDFRRLGIATELRRRARSSVDRGAADLLYGNPNLKSEGAHRKAGFACLGEVERYAKVLRSSEYAARFVPLAAISRAVGCVFDPVLRAIDGEGQLQRLADVGIRRIPDDAFDSRFDELFASAPMPRPIVGVRDQSYLQWRYGQNPLDDHTVLIAERGATLVGYLIARQRGPDLQLVDLFPPQDDAVASSLLAALFSLGRAAHARSVTLTALQGHPILPLLQRVGFRLRKGHSHMFAYAAPGSNFSVRVASGGLWAAMDGDRDV